MLSVLLGVGYRPKDHEDRASVAVLGYDWSIAARDNALSQFQMNSNHAAHFVNFVSIYVDDWRKYGNFETSGGQGAGTCDRPTSTGGPFKCATAGRRPTMDLTAKRQRQPEHSGRFWASDNSNNMNSSSPTNARQNQSAPMSSQGLAKQARAPTHESSAMRKQSKDIGKAEELEKLAMEVRARSEEVHGRRETIQPRCVLMFFLLSALE